MRFLVNTCHTDDSVMRFPHEEALYEVSVYLYLHLHITLANSRLVLRD